MQRTRMREPSTVGHARRPLPADAINDRKAGAPNIKEKMSSIHLTATSITLATATFAAVASADATTINDLSLASCISANCSSESISGSMASAPFPEAILAGQAIGYSGSGSVLTNHGGDIHRNDQTRDVLLMAQSSGQSSNPLMQKLRMHKQEFDGLRYNQNQDGNTLNAMAWHLEEMASIYFSFGGSVFNKGGVELLDYARQLRLQASVLSNADDSPPKTAPGKEFNTDAWNRYKSDHFGPGSVPSVMDGLMPR